MSQVSQVRDFRLVQSLGEDAIGREACAAPHDHFAVRLWLRLLSCSTQIEQEIRLRLRRRFATTLPRFDYLAQLERHPQGLRMSALSRYLMVTGGNVTGLTDQLVADGWVERVADPQDRRSLLVRLTPTGRAEFLAMAAEHEGWLVEMLQGFEPAHRDTLYELLGRLRVHLAGKEAAGAPAGEPPGGDGGEEGRNQGAAQAGPHAGAPHDPLPPRAAAARKER